MICSILYKLNEATRFRRFADICLQSEGGERLIDIGTNNNLFAHVEVRTRPVPVCTRRVKSRVRSPIKEIRLKFKTNSKPKRL